VVAYFRERIGIPCFASHIDKGVDSKKYKLNKYMDEARIKG
jgi:hypothetical protein